MAGIVAGMTLLLAGGLAAAADPPGTPAGRAALTACERARGQDGLAALDAAVAQAEAAVASEPEDPLAHFALFCALGERTRRRGASLRSLFALRRLRAAIDRTLALAPEFPDALVGKANLLLDAPGWLGGDAEEGAQLLRRALEIDPGYLRARRDLARALDRLGRRYDARAEAKRALDDARAHGDAEDVAAAEALVEALRP